MRALERDGLIERTVHPSVPPKVEYELTDLGSSLVKPFSALSRWAEKHRGAIESARQRSDAKMER
ncbi:MAG TPA: helix-turn-helix domain-containing protein [Thermoanaerobaculia bacterium]|nr:helix-turn-helix domain-containing protein [Thermoanaerobaculia bacterium]